MGPVHAQYKVKRHSEEGKLKCETRKYELAGKM
jgi:hypothetical protein